MRPRNLRKPTERRCYFWWRDFTLMWYGFGIMTYQLLDDE